MIIVSQDRKEIINFNYGFCLNILTGTRKQVINIDGHKIGEYKTEERAKEVLQDIANTYTLIGFEFEDINGGSRQRLPIYEMPED